MNQFQATGMLSPKPAGPILPLGPILDPGYASVQYLLSCPCRPFEPGDNPHLFVAIRFKSRPLIGCYGILLRPHAYFVL